MGKRWAYPGFVSKCDVRVTRHNMPKTWLSVCMAIVVDYTYHMLLPRNELKSGLRVTNVVL